MCIYDWVRTVNGHWNSPLHPLPPPPIPPRHTTSSRYKGTVNYVYNNKHSWNRQQVVVLTIWMRQFMELGFYRNMKPNTVVLVASNGSWVMQRAHRKNTYTRCRVPCWNLQTVVSFRQTTLDRGCSPNPRCVTWLSVPCWTSADLHTIMYPALCCRHTYSEDPAIPPSPPKTKNKTTTTTNKKTKQQKTQTIKSAKILLLSGSCNLVQSPLPSLPLWWNVLDPLQIAVKTPFILWNFPIISEVCLW